MAAFEEYIYFIIKNQNNLTKKESNKVKSIDFKDLQGGVNKKFDPYRGYVITMKDSGRSDYDKESSVKNILNNSTYIPKFLAERGIQKEYFNSFISFQNELDEDVGELYGRQKEDFRKVSLYEDMITKGYNEIIERQQLFSCIHQLLFIHFILFINGIKHGDMHMKNIKWIKFNYGNQAFFNIKAFDFGHAILDCKGVYGGQRYADLDYLFKRSSQKKACFTTNKHNFRIVGFFEGISRKLDYSNETNQDRMEKHFPLHHLLTNHNVNNLRRFSKENAVKFLEIEGNFLEKNLRRINNKNINNQEACEAVLKEFISTSERIVNQLR
ncbi:hypothetical protein FRA_44c11810 [Francisella sp. W12-1067]|nr:hypothetical protein FRA_44c11810 [Francisella sp. W12-1067]